MTSITQRIIYNKDDLLSLRHNQQNKIDYVFITSKDTQKFENTKYATFKNKVDMNDEIILNKLKMNLIKLSDNNYDKLVDDIVNMKIPEHILSSFVDTIYRYSIECIFYIHIYVNLIMKFKEKNPKLFNLFIENLLEQFKNPPSYSSNDEENKTKRYELGNITIIAHLYKMEYFNKEFIKSNIFDRIFHMTRVTDLELILKWFEIIDINQFKEYVPLMSELLNDKKFSTKSRFALQDLISKCIPDEEKKE